MSSKCLAQGQYTAEVGIQLRTSHSGLLHSTTRPSCSPIPKLRHLIIVASETFITSHRFLLLTNFEQDLMLLEYQSCVSHSIIVYKESVIVLTNSLNVILHSIIAMRIHVNERFIL